MIRLTGAFEVKEYVLNKEHFDEDMIVQMSRDKHEVTRIIVFRPGCTPSYDFLQVKETPDEVLRLIERDGQPDADPKTDMIAELERQITEKDIAISELENAKSALETDVFIWRTEENKASKRCNDAEGALRGWRMHVCDALRIDRNVSAVRVVDVINQNRDRLEKAIDKSPDKAKDDKIAELEKQVKELGSALYKSEKERDSLKAEIEEWKQAASINSNGLSAYHTATNPDQLRGRLTDLEMQLLNSRKTSAEMAYQIKKKHEELLQEKDAFRIYLNKTEKAASEVKNLVSLLL